MPAAVKPLLATLAVRLTLLFTLFALELSCLSLLLNKEAISDATGLVALIRDRGAWVLRATVAFSAIFIPLLFFKNRAALADVPARQADWPFRKTLFAAHLGALAVFGALSAVLFGQLLHGWQADLLASLWFITGMSAIVVAALALIPVDVWKLVTSGTGNFWLYTLLAAIYACAVGTTSPSLWEPARRLTFALVHFLLTPILPDMFADPVSRLIGTSRFYIRLAPECSGLEGVGLILSFTLAWLVICRKECRFPGAFVLLPAGVLLIFLLNTVRISALIAIGDAGASRAALQGFHSQAGWILFNGVALLFAAGSSRLSWLRRDVAPVSVVNPVAPYLAPFIATLAAGMFSTAISGEFEWLYPCRFGAAAIVLWHFRQRYADLNWRLTWAGPAIGILVFVLWIALDRSGAQPMPGELLAAPRHVRLGWLVIRTLAAAVTVPLAEELAFRGYLLRRLISEDFESVSPRTFTWISFVFSSVLFGLLHTGHWLAGTLAGFCYAAAVLRRGSIMDAIVAHGTTNALLAVSAVAFGNWQYW